MGAIATPRRPAPEPPAGYRCSASGLLIPATFEAEQPRQPRVRWRTSVLIGAAYGVILLVLAMAGPSLLESLAAMALVVGGVDAAAGRGVIPDLRGPFDTPP
jgi:hypothetical protein